MYRNRETHVGVQPTRAAIPGSLEQHTHRAQQTSGSENSTQTHYRRGKIKPDRHQPQKGGTDRTQTPREDEKAEIQQKRE